MFKKLQEVAEGKIDLLTVRSTDVWLQRLPEPTLFITINGEMEALTSSKERRAHFSTASLWLKSQMEEWESGKPEFVQIGHQTHPLEVITGDIALVLNLQGERYLVSFFRDIEPIGWLVAGGCPRERKDLSDVRGLAFREGSEELIITDKCNRAYQLFPAKEALESSIRALKLKINEVVTLSARELFPVQGDAQNLKVIFDTRETLSRVNLSVDCQTASVAATFYYEAELPFTLDELSIFDGELFPDGTPIHRPVQLTDKDGHQTAIFSRGHNILAGKGEKPRWITERTKRRAIIP